MMTVLNRTPGTRKSNRGVATLRARPARHVALGAALLTVLALGACADRDGHRAPEVQRDTMSHGGTENGG